MKKWVLGLLLGFAVAHASSSAPEVAAAAPTNATCTSSTLEAVPPEQDPALLVCSNDSQCASFCPDGLGYCLYKHCHCL